MATLSTIVDIAGVIAALPALAILANHLRLAAAGRSHPDLLPVAPPVPLVDAASALRVLVQIPVYNEAGSVEGALEAAAALDWPRERLTIQLLDDSTDETTAIAAAVIARLSAGGVRIEHHRRPDRHGFKAGALAAGLAGSDADFVAVLDADFRSPSDWIGRAVAAFGDDDRVAFVQFRFEFRNRHENHLTRAQQLTVDAHFLAEQAGRLVCSEPFQFNGTAGVWRRRAIEDAGGWSADTLAEDLDIVIRSFARGWRGRLVLAPVLTCEAPANLKAWRVQQQRWSRGFVEVAVKLVPPVWRMPQPLGVRLGTFMLLGLQAALPSVLAAAVLYAADIALRGAFTPVHGFVAAAALALVIIAGVAITYPPYARLRRGSLGSYTATLFLLPFLFLGLSVAGTPGMVAALLGRRSKFHRTPKTGTDMCC